VAITYSILRLLVGLDAECQTAEMALRAQRLPETAGAMTCLAKLAPPELERVLVVSLEKHGDCMAALALTQARSFRLRSAGQAKWNASSCHIYEDQVHSPLRAGGRDAAPPAAVNRMLTGDSSGCVRSTLLASLLVYPSLLVRHSRQVGRRG
jgi:hypothetical protein